MTVYIEGDHEYTAAQSHPSGHKVNTDLNPTAKRNQGEFCVHVCGSVGFGWQRSWHCSHQVMACLPSENEGRENKQKRTER